MSEIKRKNWTSSFTLIGKARVNDNTFTIDKESDSGFKYNRLNLSVDCGDEHGIIFSSMMGGFSTKRDNVIYVHGKNDDGRDDFKNKFSVNWEDRTKEEVLDTIGDFCFTPITLEKTQDGKNFTKRFLSKYDAVSYVAQHLSDGDVVKVRGNLKYSFYEDNVSMQREISSIEIVDVEPKDFCATFIQSVIIDEDSVDKKEDIDKEKNCVHVHGRVLDYVKELNGVEIRGQYPLPFVFDYDIPNGELNDKVYKLMLTSPKGTVKQVNFEGKFVQTGSVVTATMEDIPEDIKDMIAMGLFDENEILTRYASSNNSEKRNVIVRPAIRMDGDEDNRVMVPQIFEEQYEVSVLENVGVIEPVTTEPLVDDDFDIDALFG